jgi:nucleoside phosphorylase
VIGILFATEVEAAPFIAEMQRRCPGSATDTDPTRFRHRDTVLAVEIIGMGKAPAETGTRKFIDRLHPERIVNAGIAGALVDTLRIGQIYCVSAATDWPEATDRPIACDTAPFDDLEAVRLVTCNAPVFDDALRRTLSSFGELVDMEGAATARVCEESGIPCAALKCVSDFAAKGDRQTLHRNLRSAASALALRLVQFVLGPIRVSM